MDKETKQEAKPEIKSAPVAQQGIEANRGYVREKRGYPVEPGQTWQDLTHAQRAQWMREHENRWKGKFRSTAQSAGGTMDWTRG